MIFYNFNSKRFPIITILGHVDHGKTSIINCLRKNKDVIFEIGEITQSIKAYEIVTKYGKMVFLDTPGHDSFKNMREKGINITDIAILVISIDDGIKSQTIESIDYIKKFNIPTIIVISKIDKGFNNINKIKNDLLKYNFLSKDWGGNIEIVYISTKNNQGIDDLLKEINDKTLKLNLNFKKDKKYLDICIIESFIDIKNNVVLYLIIKNSFIEIGDFIVFQNQYSKIKYIKDEYGKNSVYTIPSLPYYVYGLSKIPKTINKIFISNNIHLAKKKYFSYKKENDLKKNDNNIYNIDNYLNISNKKEDKLNYIIKVDKYGSFNAINHSIKFIKNFDSFVNIVKHNIGSINKNDIILSYYSKSKLIGFNIKINNKELKLIKEKNIFFKNYYIIYDLIDFIKNDINNFLLKINENNFSKGKAKIINIFSSSKKNTILGCKIDYGRIKVNSSIKIIRNKLLIYNGKIYSLKFEKKNIVLALEGSECGVLIKGKFDIKRNDILISN